MTSPLVTVGMPVYNGDFFFKRALISVIHQSYRNIEVIISNNCSTDKTLEIIEFYAKKDNRIRYYNQTKRIPLEDNFKFVLNKSNSEYFMWAAADDLRSRDFIHKNIEFLQNNHDYVGSTSPTRFFRNSFNPKRVGDFSIKENNPGERISTLLSSWDANARLWSLFRTKELKKLNFESIFLGVDLYYMMQLVLIGKLNRLDSGLIRLGKFGTSHKENIFKKYRKNNIEFILPFFTLLNKSIRLTNKFQIRFVMIYKILKFNYVANLVRIKWLILKIIK